MMKALVTEHLSPGFLELLEKVVDKVDVDEELWRKTDQLSNILSNYEVLIVKNLTKITKNVLQSASRLKVIGRDGVGLDSIDLNEATQKGIFVVNAAEANAISVAEFTICLTLVVMRQIEKASKSIRKGKWERFNMVGMELYQKNVGIIGFGRIGSRVAERFAGFKTNLLVNETDTNLNKKIELIRAKVVSFDELLEKSDVISLHCPLTDETKSMISFNEFDKMKSNAILINTARAAIVNINALVKALQERRIAGAAVDVFEEEPPPQDYPLFDFDNVVITPHFAGLTFDAARRQSRRVVEGIELILKGETPDNLVNPEVLKKIV